MPTNNEERPRVYLNKVHLKGYKSIEDVTIDFQKGLNILIGKNGAGKSNFLEMINLAIGFKRNVKLPFRSSRLEYKSIDDHNFAVELEREVPAKTEEGYLVDGTGVLETFSFDNDILFDNSKNESIRFYYGGKRIYYRNVPHLLYQLGYSFYNNLYLKFDLPTELGCIESPGVINIVEVDKDYWEWEFPKTLRFLDDVFFAFELQYGTDNTSLREITSLDITEKLKINDNIIYNLKLFTPIEDVRVNNNINIYHLESTVVVENVKLDFKINGNWLPWSQLSDGTRRLFYIVSEITNTQALVLLEEPELGVHPHQFHLLMNFLKEQSEHKQIIISTHAPKALDHLNLDELNSIVLVNYDQKNGTQLRHLTDDEQAKAQEYAKEVGYVSDYWMYSDLEE
ncbi:AAA family ATPase [Mucilaginibacter sp. P25]|uniref:AAA domain-containing protein, putative AbiEii toxin, Type IV TA system n=1 Tax=Mucilaginibacter gossypii TaxID=551996 RepID=A0A1G8IKL7_9SPHI|nr:ATP-binding protein [Mucilaginibacter gossypii]SDI19455.1 AAA domain-containing protein, putative AbiEii toxin, Type IV TA system [Mucilaginibacter gossypii]